MYKVIVFHHRQADGIAAARRLLPDCTVYRLPQDYTKVCQRWTERDMALVVTDIRHLRGFSGLRHIVVVSIEDDWLQPQTEQKLKAVHRRFFSHYPWEDFYVDVMHCHMSNVP